MMPDNRFGNDRGQLPSGPSRGQMLFPLKSAIPFQPQSTVAMPLLFVEKENFK